MIWWRRLLAVFRRPAYDPQLDSLRAWELCVELARHGHPGLRQHFERRDDREKTCPESSR